MTQPSPRGPSAGSPVAGATRVKTAVSPAEEASDPAIRVGRRPAAAPEPVRVRPSGIESLGQERSPGAGGSRLDRFVHPANRLAPPLFVPSLERRLAGAPLDGHRLQRRHRVPELAR